MAELDQPAQIPELERRFLGTVEPVLAAEAKVHIKQIKNGVSLKFMCM